MDKYLSEFYLSSGRSFSYSLSRVQREELSIAWILSHFKNYITNVFLSPWWYVTIFLLTKLFHVFLVTAGEDGYLGELCTQLGSLSRQRFLRFPWSCLPPQPPTFFFCTAQKWKAHLWKAPHSGLTGCHSLLWPFVLFLQSAREALKLWQLFISSRDIMLFLSRLSSPAKSGILLFDNL